MLRLRVDLMKELFRDSDLTKVTYFRNLLEGEGIATMMRNEHLQSSGLAEIPIPEFFPALCVMSDEDYERAVSIIREHVQSNQERSDEEVACAGCGEMNPGNFDICWSCGGEISG